MVEGKSTHPLPLTGSWRSRISYIHKRREKNPEKKTSMDTRCRVFHRQEESTFHLVCSCPVLAPTVYLHSRHNQVARVVYQEIVESDKPIYNPPRVTTRDQLEIWWDMEVYTTTKVNTTSQISCCGKTKKKHANW